MKTEREIERDVQLEPGQVQCDCGRIIEKDETRDCCNCGHRGCIHCQRPASNEDAELNDEYVCGDDCELEWIEYQMKTNERFYHSTQDRLGKQLEALRQKREDA